MDLFKFLRVALVLGQLLDAVQEARLAELETEARGGPKGHPEGHKDRARLQRLFEGRPAPFPVGQELVSARQQLAALVLLKPHREKTQSIRWGHRYN